MKRRKVLSILLLLSMVCFRLTAETGYASWYGGKFQGRRTASGEIFDTHKMTAAHKTLPFGTIVEVTNLNNGKSTQVRINDRGPFVESRIIDLSMAAAKAIEMLGSGVAPVKVEVVEKADKEANARFQPKPNSYSIQIASFSEEENAERLHHLLSEQGLKPKYENTGSGHIRVVLNNLEEEELKPTLDRLSRIGHPSVLVRRHF